MLQANVTSWRRDRLVEAGFPFREASGLALDSRYDLHALIELAEQGCPPQLALRILAPMEEGTAA
jgi:hypothetical protein